MQGFILLINIQFEPVVSIIWLHYLLQFAGALKRKEKAERDRGMKTKDRKKAYLISTGLYANLLCKLAVKLIP